ncbi:MAG: UxaA family hydrolase [Acidimicrobiales bacterium]
MTTTTAPPCLRLRSDDTVGVMTAALPAGADLVVGDLVVRLRDDLPAGHKVALAEVAAGDQVRKYGQVIGVATRPIRAGEHVHTHNLAFADFGRDYAFGQDLKVAGGPAVEPTATFKGIVRSDGQVATRNYIGILTSVNCSATVARMVAGQFGAGSELLAGYPNVDGVVALTHGSGCGMAASGEGFELLRRTLSGYARHPNFAALLVIGLGCEVNQVRALTEGFDLAEATPLLPMTIQDMGGTRATVREATARIRDLAGEVNNVVRTDVPAGELVLGLECGGSDAYSGISANPALGVAADLLVRQGGTAVLGETPEIYGAEHLLTRRAVSREVGEKLVDRVHWWESYVKSCGASLDNNPSPGNKEGGLTTILEKSLGAVAKGGGSPLTAVYEYAERVTAKGFAFMDTPGYDPVSVTGMVAGGANVVCFTTGRGSVFGSKPAPCIKLATNSDVYRRMSEDMDVNCGTIVDGTLSVDDVGREIFDLVLAVASGQRTKSEELGFGDEEFTPWQLGAVL